MKSVDKRNALPFYYKPFLGISYLLKALLAPLAERLLIDAVPNNSKNRNNPCRSNPFQPQQNCINFFAQVSQLGDLPTTIMPPYRRW